MGSINVASLTRTEWLKERQHGIGSSEIASILGLNPYQTPLDVYNSKLGDPELEERKETPKTRAGLLIEPVIAQIFEEETGFKVQNDNKIRYNDKVPFLRANLDRMIIKPEGKTTPGVLEMKNTEHRTIAHWEENDSGGKELPLYYWCQIQHQMFCAGWNWGHLFFFVSGYDTRDFVVEPNNDFLDGMCYEAGNFWHNHVLKHIPPPPRTAADIAQLFPKSMQDKVVEAGEALYETYVEAYAAHTELKLLQQKFDILKERIIVAMGDGEVLQHNGVNLITYKQQNAFDAVAFRREEPGYAAQCIKRLVDKNIVKEKYPEMYKAFTERIGPRTFLVK